MCKITQHKQMHEHICATLGHHIFWEQLFIDDATQYTICAIWGKGKWRCMLNVWPSAKKCTSYLCIAKMPMEFDRSIIVLYHSRCGIFTFKGHPQNVVKSCYILTRAVLGLCILKFGSSHFILIPFLQSEGGNMFGKKHQICM